ncbi:MAG: PilZ domain-containing protein [Acidobacteria bacterium]|nr:PilZ domain-containing protein [Acidobacteriota bacterium]
MSHGAASFAGSVSTVANIKSRPTVRQFVDDRRNNPRLPLNLPVRVTKINHNGDSVDGVLLSRDISTMGVFFLSPKRLDPGTPVNLEVGLVDRPLDRGRVRLETCGQVVRTEITDTPGWHGLAVRFDEISFNYEDVSSPGRA